LQAGGVVNGTTFTALVAPIVAAVAPIDPGSRGLGALTVACARQHLAQSPREVGGENMGPWVRLYMKGNEGTEWAWCAGFVGYLLRQAGRALGAAVPLPYTFSCDSLASAARDAGLFLDGRKGVSPGQITAGSLFLVRRTPLDWVHTGLVLSAGPTAFDTIEGNTNDSGDREGYEVCRRTRGYDGKDFILIA
jgi:hypothetical protein